MTFNMDTLHLTLTFIKIVDSASFQETELMFQEGPNRTVSYTLTDITRLTLDPSTVVETQLRENDAVAKLGLDWHLAELIHTSHSVVV